MKNSSFVVYVASLLSLTFGCSHKNPSTTPDPRQPAMEANAIEAADMTQIKTLVLSKDVESFRQKLLAMQIAQTLTTNFDMRIEKIKTSKEMDLLFGSNLYCKLMNVRSLHDKFEDDLIYALTVAKTAGPESENWFYQQMSTFATASVANKAAMAQLFHGLANEEIQICGVENCVKKDLSKVSGLNLNPLNNKEMSRFIKANRAVIADAVVDRSKFSSPENYKNTDLLPGTCFSTDNKREPQAESYDWTNRNWVGSVLPTGQFVFTYDDGPHASYTRAIRDTWAEAGFPKPAFFWLRKNASSLAPIVSELNNQGYVIGSHSERHADLGNLAKANSPADFNGVNKQMFGVESKGLSDAAFATWKSNTLDREINQSVKDLSAILGKPVRYFRLPYGSGVKNDLIGARFQALNLDHFFWRVDSLDWQDKNPESIRDRVLTQMNVVKKGIVLFHDIHPQSAQAAKLMVEYFKTNTTYKPVSISTIPGLKP